MQQPGANFSTALAEALPETGRVDGPAPAASGPPVAEDGFARMRPLQRLARYAGVIHYIAGKHPALFYPLFRLRGGYGMRNPVRRDTDLVIEGYPRSGNTFALLAFRLSQHQPVKTADHFHVPAQVMLAARYGVPACVLIRDPEDVVRSLVVKYPFIRPKDALRGYRSFYRACLRYRDHFVAASFDQVTSDFGEVVDSINAKFGTNFVRFEHREANIRRVFDFLDERNEALDQDDLESPRPTVSKDEAKNGVSFADCGTLLARCRAIFDEFVNPSVRS